MTTRNSFEHGHSSTLRAARDQAIQLDMTSRKMSLMLAMSSWLTIADRYKQWVCNCATIFSSLEICGVYEITILLFANQRIISSQGINISSHSTTLENMILLDACENMCMQVTYWKCQSYARDAQQGRYIVWLMP